MFPDCRIIVPLRDPAAHAASLLRQHKNFLTRHAEDTFTRRYMRTSDIWSLVNCTDRSHSRGFSPHRIKVRLLTIGCFIGSWRFAKLSGNKDKCLFVPQDELRERPQETMLQLCEDAGIECEGADFSGFFRSGADRVEASPFSVQLLQEAQDLYARLVP